MTDVTQVNSLSQVHQTQGWTLVEGNFGKKGRDYNIGENDYVIIAKETRPFTEQEKAALPYLKKIGNCVKYLLAGFAYLITLTFAIKFKCVEKALHGGGKTHYFILNVHEDDTLKLAAKGDGPSQLEIGRRHYANRNITEARPWYELAAAKGGSDATYHLGLTYHEECKFDQAAQYFKKAKCAGSIYFIGRYHEEGLGGLGKSLFEAFAQYKVAVSLGSVDAIKYLPDFVQNHLEYRDQAIQSLQSFIAARESNPFILPGNPKEKAEAALETIRNLQ